MNWFFWKAAHSSLLDSCETIEPLLTLFADQMASPLEGRLVDAHLRECVSCRDTLNWMQATRRTLANRPVAMPPHDLRARIAEAIAASEVVPVQSARSFRLRPAYAAAASLTALGVILLGHTLSAPHSAPPQSPQPVQISFNPPAVAPGIKSTPILKTVPSIKHSLPSSRHDERMVAVPNEASSSSANSHVLIMPHIKLPIAGQSLAMKAELAGLHSLLSHPQKQIVRIAVLPKAERSSDHVLSLSGPTPPAHAPEVASSTAPQTVSIGTPKILPVEPAPAISVASSNHPSEAHIQTASLLGSVQDYALRHQSSLERNLSLASNKAIRGAVYRTALTSGLESPVSFADIHSP